MVTGTCPCSSSWRRIPGRRRRSATLTTSGPIEGPRLRPSGLILIEERLVLARVLGPGQGGLLGRWEGGDAELLPAGLHRLDRALEDDLEAGQLLVGVVL